MPRFLLVSLLLLAVAGPALGEDLQKPGKLGLAEPAGVLLEARSLRASVGPLKAPKAVDPSKGVAGCFFGAISCGQTVSSELDPADCDFLGDGTRMEFWDFQGTDGDRVIITQRSSEFDSYTILFDTLGMDRATDDDSGGGVNGFDSQIEFTLDQTGTWTIGSNGFFPADIGNYTLTLECPGVGQPGPAAPSNLTATATSMTEIRLDWQDNSNNEDEFRVEIRETGAGAFQDIGAVSADSIGAIVQDLAADTSYDFRVRARNAQGDSMYSNVASARTFGLDPGDCNPADPELICLLEERFKVEVDWRNNAGETGRGMTVPFGSNDSGLLWFFAPDNWEMLIKMVDACNSPFDSFWVFIAATTDVEYTVTVTDTQTGATKQYFNPLNNAAAAVTDTQAFLTCP